MSESSDGAVRTAGDLIRWRHADWSPAHAHGAVRAIDVERHTGVTAPYRFVDLVRVPPGSSIGRHTHEADSAEIYVALSGTACFELEGVVSQVSAGDVMCNVPGGTHALWNDTDTEFTMVVIEAEVPSR